MYWTLRCVAFSKLEKFKSINPEILSSRLATAPSCSPLFVLAQKVRTHPPACRFLSFAAREQKSSRGPLEVCLPCGVSWLFALNRSFSASPSFSLSSHRAYPMSLSLCLTLSLFLPLFLRPSSFPHSSLRSLLRRCEEVGTRMTKMMMVLQSPLSRSALFAFSTLFLFSVQSVNMGAHVRVLRSTCKNVGVWLRAHMVCQHD